MHVILLEAPGRGDHVELDVVGGQGLAVGAVSEADGLELNELLRDRAPAGAGESFLRPHLDVVDPVVDRESVESRRSSDTDVSPAREAHRIATETSISIRSGICD